MVKDEISTKELASIAGVSIWTVHQWVRSGAVKRSRDCGSKRDKTWLDLESVNRFLEERKYRLQHQANWIDCGSMGYM